MGGRKEGQTEGNRRAGKGLQVGRLKHSENGKTPAPCAAGALGQTRRPPTPDCQGKSSKKSARQRRLLNVLEEIQSTGRAIVTRKAETLACQGLRRELRGSR